MFSLHSETFSYEKSGGCNKPLKTTQYISGKNKFVCMSSSCGRPNVNGQRWVLREPLSYWYRNLTFTVSVSKHTVSCFLVEMHYTHIVTHCLCCYPYHTGMQLQKVISQIKNTQINIKIDTYCNYKVCCYCFFFRFCFLGGILVLTWCMILF